MAATSIFFMVIMAWKARLASSPTAFGATYRNAEEMWVAEGHVGDWDFAGPGAGRAEFVLRNADFCVGQR